MSATSTSARRPSKKTAAEKTEQGNDGPAIILVEPQMAENIGMVARAMLNSELYDLRLVRPRDGWPNERAYPPSSGADMVLDKVQVFDTTVDAIADLGHVFATTARARDMSKDVFTPKKAASAIRETSAGGVKCGVLFGREAWGLNNDDVALADSILMVPLNPAFSSLNLAQAVLLIGYEWYQAGIDKDLEQEVFEIRNDTRIATKEELIGFFEHLEDELDESGFLRVAAKRPNMVRNLRNLFNRARMTEQEVRTMRGVVASLARAHDRDKNKK